METRRDINFDKYKYMSFKLEKLEDTEFDDDHPNVIDVGFAINEANIDLKLSNKLCALVVYEMPDRLFHTSEIRKQKECKGYDLLYTLNSIYKITPNFINLFSLIKSIASINPF